MYVCMYSVIDDPVIFTTYTLYAYALTYSYDHSPSAHNKKFIIQEIKTTQIAYT
jgi:hypothetical protein